MASDLRLPGFGEEPVLAGQEFDLSGSPLNETLLIDASAGTGKTYTIAALVVRLLLESRLPLAEILVVTFTEAAAEDLRRRIRQKIRAASQAFALGASEDLFLARLLAGTDDHQEARRLLDLALSCFDEAAVFTIHGFCQRVLAEHSLESGVSFDSELVTDLRDLLREISEDFFRINLYDASPLTAAFLRQRFAPAALRQRLGAVYAREDVRVIPTAEGDKWRNEVRNGEAAYLEAFRATAAAWPARRRQVTGILMESPALMRNRYRCAQVPGWLAALTALLEQPSPPPELFERFDRFTPEVLATATKKGQTLEEEPFFARCAQLYEAHTRLQEGLAGLAQSLEVDLFPYVRAELAKRKARLRVHSFDDLLTFLHQALRGAQGRELAARLRRKYRAAMIDEFQDTDPVQYEIFTRLFASSGILLCLIGDPKQAIYSFRGADIFAYIRAVRDVSHRFTLRENWRSRPELIRAVNAVFSGRPAPFVFEEIAFAPARPASRAPEPLILDQEEAVPFHLWMAQRDDEQGPQLISKDEARRLLLSWLQEEIGRLLRLAREGRACLGSRPLSPGDLAVLVRTNREARLVQGALAAIGVASVLNSSESLFASREAAEVLLLLQALAERHNRRRIRAALATRLLGADSARLDLHGDEDGNLGEWFDRFGEYHELWRQHGFVVMFSSLLVREGVRERLLALPGGERSLTNVLHLLEVLHRATEERRLGLAGLGRYLGDKIAQAEDNPAEELQLRLASDSALVQIVTIHKAKGLQYPVVFCPFCWEGSRLLGLEERAGKGRPPAYLFHEEKDFAPVLDLGSTRLAGNRILSLREEAAESQRLLYVALTRAIHSCYLFWGPFRGAGTSALAYLLHGETELEATPAWGTDLLQGLSDAELDADLKKVVERAGDGISLVWRRETAAAAVLPPAHANLQAVPRYFTGVIRSDWRIESFSSLHQAHGSEARVSGLGHRPDGGRAPADTVCFTDILNFPAGPGPGTFLHGLLEGLDFRAPKPEARRLLIQERLATAGYDQRWGKALELMLDDLLHARLSAHDDQLVLAAIGQDDRLSELEFYFPLAEVNQEALNRLLSDRGFCPPSVAGSGSGPELKTAPALRGMMKGYIDLVFRQRNRYYIVDWKSNHLGWDPADYAEERLPAVMAREGYYLQYLIYTVALHHYLRSRLPDYSYEKHFGGVFYLFLRGVRQSAGPGFGIFRHKPDPELVESLARCFAGQSGATGHLGLVAPPRFID